MHRERLCLTVVAGVALRCLREHCLVLRVESLGRLKLRRPHRVAMMSSGGGGASESTRLSIQYMVVDVLRFR